MGIPDEYRSFNLRIEILIIDRLSARDFNRIGLVFQSQN